MDTKTVEIDVQDGTCKKMDKPIWKDGDWTNLDPKIQNQIIALVDSAVKIYNPLTQEEMHNLQSVIESNFRGRYIRTTMQIHCKRKLAELNQNEINQEKNKELAPST